MIAPIAFTMASGGDGAPRQPTKHAYIATKGNPINVDADKLSDSGSGSDITSIPSDSVFLSSKELDE
eukprot:12230538-Ditylum_brightwellii.AAC.2